MLRQEGAGRDSHGAAHSRVGSLARWAHVVTKLLPLAGLALFLGATARAETPAEPATAAVPERAVLVRTGNHDTFGRVVFDLPPGVSASARADGAGGVRVRVYGGKLSGDPLAPRNVVSLGLAGNEAHLTLMPGATYTHLMVMVVRWGAQGSTSSRIHHLG